MPDGAPLIDPDIVAGRIGMLLRERRSGAVKPLLAALEKLAPDHQDLAALRASYCCQIGDFAAALAVLEAAILQSPGKAELHLLRSEVLFGQAAYAGAAIEAAEAILLAPNLTRAKSVLGLALLQLGQFDSALPCLAESFAADPSAIDVALGFAALAPEKAGAILIQAIAATPRLTLLRNALARRYLRLGDVAAASQVALQAVADGLADAESYCLLACAQMQQGCPNEAATSVARALSIAPEHRFALELADQLRAGQQPECR
jgi:predicted Zn-dependent protease